MRIFPVAILALALSGCVGVRSASPYASQDQSKRSPSESEQLALKAAVVMASDPDKAAGLLRRALALDLFNGAAHNNLGVLALKKGDVYTASQEFEWARKLIPGSPDPRVNLALALERAGHTTEALDAYTAALEVRPEYVPAIQGLARLEVRSGRADSRLEARLQKIALEGETGQWREWAQNELVKRAGADEAVATPPR